MSDWLEPELARELARELAPVAAPHALGIRLGFAPAKRWAFPRHAVALAAAVILAIGGSYAANRTAPRPLPSRPGECVAAVNSPVSAGKATVLLAHEGSAKVPDHALSASEAGCHLCHSL